MMSLATIQAESRKAAADAARRHRTPMVLTQEDVDSYQTDPYQGFPFPNLGTYTPAGWTLDRKMFVDASGLGDSGEPALTVPAFVRELRVGKGYAIVEAGPFQVYIGEFTPPLRRRK